MKKILLASVMLCALNTFTARAQQTNSKSPEPVYAIADKMPELKGGADAMASFLNQNLEYPKAARKAGIEGQVRLKGLINKYGKLEQVYVTRSVDPQLDAEAMRVFKAMDNWEPGMKDGVAVNAWYTLPIMFRLEEK